MLVFVISNSIYVIICFVVFIAYVFGYISLNGLLSNNRDKMTDKPKAPSFNSLKGGGNSTISENERRSIEEAMNGNQEETGDTFMFDQSAKIGEDLEASSDEHLNEDIENFEKKKYLMDQPFLNSSEENHTTSESIGELIGEKNLDLLEPNEEDTDEDQSFWNVAIADDDEHQPIGIEEKLIGDMSAEELILLDNLKNELHESEEGRVRLMKECIEVNEEVNRLERDTENRIEVIVSKLLTSRERVIFNLFPQFHYEEAA